MIPDNSGGRVLVILGGQGSSKESQAAMCSEFAVNGFIVFCMNRGWQFDFSCVSDWVSEHAAEYGGNPRDISMYGFSMGSAIVGWMLKNDHFRYNMARLIVSGYVTYDYVNAVQNTRRLPPILMIGDTKNDWRMGNAPAIYNDAVKRRKSMTWLDIDAFGHTDWFDFRKLWNNRDKMRLYPKMMAMA